MFVELADVLVVLVFLACILVSVLILLAFRLLMSWPRSTPAVIEVKSQSEDNFYTQLAAREEATGRTRAAEVEQATAKINQAAALAAERTEALRLERLRLERQAAQPAQPASDHESDDPRH